MAKRILLAVLASALGLLAACARHTVITPDPDPSSTVGIARNSHHPIRSGDRYVALGDSYTSAPHIGDPSGLSACRQSSINYPHLVAKKLSLELDDVSCAGAQTAQMANPQPLGSKSAPPQFDALSSATKLVTLSIGANDENAMTKLILTCARGYQADPSGSPCTDAFKAGGGQDILSGYQKRTTARIVKVIGRIAELAPEARVLVIGYPQMFPATKGCPELPMASGDLAFGRRANLTFVDAMKDAAKKTGAEFVDPWQATAGHDICGPTPWVAGVDPKEPGTAFHPYAPEQAALADLIVKELQKSS